MAVLLQWSSRLPLKESSVTRRVGAFNESCQELSHDKQRAIVAVPLRLVRRRPEVRVKSRSSVEMISHRCCAVLGVALMLFFVLSAAVVKVSLPFKQMSHFLVFYRISI